VSLADDQQSCASAVKLLDGDSDCYLPRWRVMPFLNALSKRESELEGRFIRIRTSEWLAALMTAAHLMIDGHTVSRTASGVQAGQVRSCARHALTWCSGCTSGLLRRVSYNPGSVTFGTGEMAERLKAAVC
jgi:hypothetical protein